MKLLFGVIALLGVLHCYNSTPVDTATDGIEPKEIDFTDLHKDCQEPKDIGRCFAIFHRYAFNAEKLICEEFIYGGCMGNKNNFETLADCERTCLTKSGELDAEVDTTTTISSKGDEAEPTESQKID